LGNSFLEIRQKKRDSIDFISQYCHVPVQLIQELEDGDIYHLDFFQWICLASYYGKIMLSIPYVIHNLEFSIAETYFMYIRNGESVQYSAKQTKQIIIDTYKEHI
jgi:hypothetical protein